ncbi:hypothetical protein [Pseudomonas sp. DSV-1]|uniref:hypothetical protein n=1 Tax=Pseudomonas sp. DSV-1 TaxID=3112250 RepID=UPI002DBBAF79|nr:hypothetical protein [Pseudomonas sp. DSV-1]MEC4239269.1 hypothetical protein [Pseudomonas sp. DSV-1]
MSRQVTDDHILFDECIEAFRPKHSFGHFEPSACNQAYLLTDFDLSNEWKLPHCTIHPAVTMDLPGPYCAFICRMDMHETPAFNTAHFYSIALSSIITFATGRLCKPIRKAFLCPAPDGLTDEELEIASLSHPVLHAGTGSTHTFLAETTQQKHCKTVESIVLKLSTLPYKQYIIAMQAIRLTYLSLSNKRDDFGLAYLLIISAIESVAQHAFPIKKQTRRNPKEALWSKLTEGNEDLTELLQQYKEARNHKSLIKEQYLEFINTFAPPSTWSSLVRHPFQHTDEYSIGRGLNLTGSHTRKRGWEIYPEDLTTEQIQEVLGKSYTHRSCFIHRGEQPPHQNPQAFSPYFQNFFDPNGMGILPNYELLFGIAQHSIRRWMDSISI